jgi:hypothetical protein
LSAIKFQYWHDHARSFDAMATWQHLLARVDRGTEVSALRALGVSRDFFEVLGYEPVLGRGFVAAEHVPGGPAVAVISHAMWRTHFGSAADVVGRSIRLNGEAVTVVGMLPESFAFPYEDEAVEVIFPLRLSVDPNDVAENWPTIARLREGVTREQARADVVSHRAIPGSVSEPGVETGSRDDARHVQRPTW